LVCDFLDPAGMTCPGRGPSYREGRIKRFLLVSAVFAQLRSTVAVWSARIIAKLVGKKY